MRWVGFEERVEGHMRRVRSSEVIMTDGCGEARGRNGYVVLRFSLSALVIFLVK